MRIGVHQEREEALLKDIIDFEDLISEMEKELREAGKVCGALCSDGRGSKQKRRGRRVLPGVTSCAWPEAPGRRSDVSRVDVATVRACWRPKLCLKRWSRRTRKAVVRKEFAEPEEYMFCQDMEVDDNKSLEELGFGPSTVSVSAGWSEFSR